jgi:hypothetical protein
MPPVSDQRRHRHPPTLATLALVAALVCPALCLAPSLASADSDVRLAGSSRDAREVFFLSPDQLVPADRDKARDLYESAGKRLSLVATGRGQAGGANDASFRYVTPDGRRVFFQTAKSLTADDTDPAIDVYERAAGEPTLISTGPQRSDGPEAARFQAVSVDGSRVLFTSAAPLTPDDTDAAVDLYERVGTTTSLITKGTAQGIVALDRGEREIFGIPRQRAVVSQDGLQVLFATVERLSATDIDDQVDIYQAGGGAITLISTGPAYDGTCPGFDCDAALRSISPDVSRVIFDTREALTAGDADGGNDLYERSAGTTTLLSVGAAGQEVSFPDFLAASTDATRVLFDSIDKLTSDDRDTYPDIFERAAGTTRLVSGGRLDKSFAGATGPGVDFAGASADLRRVFFTTYEGLAPGDRYGDLDLYQHFGNRSTLVSGSPRAPDDENSTIEFQGCSSSGRTVVFLTANSLLPSDRGDDGDLYVRSGGRLTLITRAFKGRQGGGPRVVALSDDGKRVLFASLAQLARGDRDRNRDLYAWSKGRIRLLSGVGGAR